MQGMEIVVTYRGFVKHSDASGLYVSWCPLLDIKSQGTTLAQAKAALDDSVRLFIKHCVRRGVLEETMRKLGLEPSEDSGNDGGDDGECVSVRPVPVVDPAADDSWDGRTTVPMALMIAARMKQGADGEKWRQ